MNRKIIIVIICVLVATVIILFAWKFYKKPSEGRSLTFYGNVDIRQADLGFRVFGKVSELLVDEGDTVEPGQLLAKLDPVTYVDSMAEAQGRLVKGKADLANADQLLERREGLASVGSISEESYMQTFHNQRAANATVYENQAALRLAIQNVKDTHLVCPQAGTILTRVHEVGSVVQPGDPIFVVSVASPVWVRAYVPEPDLGRVYPGMPARIYTDTPSEYEGHVGFISPVAEFTPKNVETTALRTDLVYRMRVIVDHPDQGLRQGMPVTVKLGR